MFCFIDKISKFSCALKRSTKIGLYYNKCMSGVYNKFISFIPAFSNKFTVSNVGETTFYKFPIYVFYIKYIHVSLRLTRHIVVYVPYCYKFSIPLTKKIENKQHIHHLNGQYFNK